MSESWVSELRFPAAPDTGIVSAILRKPPMPRFLLVMGHGAGAGMRHRFMEGMSRALADRRVATFRYQFPYAEAGKRRPDRAHILTATVRAAVSTARGVEPELPVLAGGKSMGGRMTSTAQAESALPGVRGIVFFGFPLHRPGDLSNARADHLRGVEVPLLFVQGTRDRLAEMERIACVVAGLGERATLHVVTDGDHGFDVLKRTGRTVEETYAAIAGAVSDWAAAIPL